MFTLEDTLVAHESFQYIIVQLVKGFISRGKQGVMSWLTQLV